MTSNADLPQSPESERDRTHLEKSLRINWDRTPGTDAARAALAELQAALETAERRTRARRPDDQRRLTATLSAVVMDLFARAMSSPGYFIAYPRSKRVLTESSRYRNPDVTHLAAVTATNFLIEAGYIDHRGGSYSRLDFGEGVQTGSGYLSRMRATPRLLEHLQVKHGLTFRDVGDRPDAEVIILKDGAESWGGDKPRIDYPETGQTSTMRAALRHLNAVNARHQIAPAEVTVRRGRTANEKANVRDLRLDFSAVQLHRIFNNGRWDHGGRYYGGWWTVTPEEERRLITIDGEPTVELDFAALHPRLCYHLSGKPLSDDADPYALGGRLPGVPREIFKRAFNQLLNASSWMTIKAPQGIRRELPRGVSYDEVIRAVEDAHAPIQDWFRSGRGIELQNLDSGIASGVLGSFVSHGRPILPVHDSFIVRSRDEFALGQAMGLAYRAVVGDRTGVPRYPVVKGWSSEEVRTQVIISLGQP